MGIRDSVKHSFHGTLKTVLPTSPHCIKDLSTVFDAELKRIQERRRKAGLPAGDPKKDSVGIALSGGGIRSATFNLGLLQSMQRYDALEHVDYLSTVSGGGYIGSCLTWFMSVKRTGFPCGVARADHKSMGGKVLAWIRAHGKFLTPGKGLSLWPLVAATLRRK